MFISVLYKQRHRAQTNKPIYTKSEKHVQTKKKEKKNMHKEQQRHWQHETGPNTSDDLTARTDEKVNPSTRASKIMVKTRVRHVSHSASNARVMRPLLFTFGGLRSSIHDTTLGPWLQSGAGRAEDPERLLQNSSSLLYTILEFYLTKRFSERGWRKQSSSRERENPFPFFPLAVKNGLERKKKWIEFFLREIRV